MFGFNTTLFLLIFESIDTSIELLSLFKAIIPLKKHKQLKNTYQRLPAINEKMINELQLNNRNINNSNHKISVKYLVILPFFLCQSVIFLIIYSLNIIRFLLLIFHLSIALVLLFYPKVIKIK